jgi:hypothetical protein
MLRLLWIVGLVGIGCSTTIVTPRQLSVSGDYPLSSSDIRAIEALVDARPDIAKPLQSVYTDRRNHARVSSGALTRRVGSGSLFTVAKRQGKWVIDSSIEEEHIIYP